MTSSVDTGHTPDPQGNGDSVDQSQDWNHDTTGEQQGDADTGQQQAEQPLSRDEITKHINDAAQRIADRQVNALMKEVRGSKGSKRREDSSDNKTSSGDSTDDRERASVERFDEREARMAYREYLNDSHTFVDGSERALANTLGTALVGSELAEHGDPDRAGRQAASTVAEQLSAYRKAVEDATVNRLKRRGALVTEPARGGDSPPSVAAPTQSTTADLRQSARSMAQEFNQELGHSA